MLSAFGSNDVVWSLSAGGFYGNMVDGNFEGSLVVEMSFLFFPFAFDMFYVLSLYGQLIGLWSCKLDELIW